MASLRVDIAIPAERYVALYSGKAKIIHAVSQDGLKVQFPGAALNRFVTHAGLWNFRVALRPKQQVNVCRANSVSTRCSQH